MSFKGLLHGCVFVFVFAFVFVHVFAFYLCLFLYLHLHLYFSLFPHSYFCMYLSLYSCLYMHLYLGMNFLLYLCLYSCRDLVRIILGAHSSMESWRPIPCNSKAIPMHFKRNWSHSAHCDCGCGPNDGGLSTEINATNVKLHPLHSHWIISVPLKFWRKIIFFPKHYFGWLFESDMWISSY